MKPNNKEGKKVQGGEIMAISGLNNYSNGYVNKYLNNEKRVMVKNRWKAKYR